MSRTVKTDYNEEDFFRFDPQMECTTEHPDGLLTTLPKTFQRDLIVRDCTREPDSFQTDSRSKSIYRRPPKGELISSLRMLYWFAIHARCCYSFLIPRSQIVALAGRTTAIILVVESQQGFQHHKSSHLYGDSLLTKFFEEL